MNNHLAIDHNRLIRCLRELRDPEGSGRTQVIIIEIIQAYTGGFLSNRGVPASVSWTAQFGKYLKAHEAELGIQQTRGDQRIVVNGDATSTSTWALV